MGVETGIQEKYIRTLRRTRAIKPAVSIKSKKSTAGGMIRKNGMIRNTLLIIRAEIMVALETLTRSQILV
tara:strand:+ start:157 stop:366 length:210 start_codon:yes stop_codon:yes gene_type:complete